MSLLPLIFLVATLLPGASAIQPPPTTSTSRFTYVDIHADPHGKPLAAYQFEFKATVGDVQVVGIEGGEHPAFKDAPYYDPAALHGQNRVIVAAFNIDENLPKGKTRIARIHLRVRGDARPTYQAQLKTAADQNGNKIDAAISVEEGVSR